MAELTEETQGEVTFTKDQQAYIDKLIGSARVKAREGAEAKSEATQAKAKEDAEKANLAAKSEWQKLSAKHEARATALEPLEARVAAYETLIGDMLKTKVKELGDTAKKAVGALPESMTALEQLDWLNKNVELFQDKTKQGVGTPHQADKAVKDKQPHRGRKLRL